MKHIFFSFFLVVGFLCFSEKSRSQDFSLSLITDTIISGAPGQELVAYANITNNTGLPVEIDIIRIEENMASGWASSLCVDVCLPPNIDSTRLYLPASQTQLFTFHFYSSMSEDSSNANILFRNAGNPAEFYEQRLYAETDSIYLGMEESADLLASKFSFYPNPASVGKSIQINIDPSIFQNSNQTATLVIFDQTGKKTGRIEEIKSGNNSLELQNLSPGIYFFSIRQMEKIVFSKKIVISSF